MRTTTPTPAQEAERRRVLIEQVTRGRVRQTRATVNDLVDRWLSVAQLELTTTINYESYIERIIPHSARQDGTARDPESCRGAQRPVCAATPVPQIVRRPTGPGRPPSGRPGQAPSRRCRTTSATSAASRIGARAPRRRGSTRSTRSCTAPSRSQSSSAGWTATPPTSPAAPGAPRQARPAPGMRCACLRPPRPTGLTSRCSCGCCWSRARAAASCARSAGVTSTSPNGTC
jgi:hypothetical protein